MQVGEGEQVHLPAGRVHSVATLDPRVCLSLYSTAAFGKGKKDKMADTSTKKYQRLKRKYLEEAKVAKAAEEAKGAVDPQKPKKKNNNKRR